MEFCKDWSTNYQAIIKEDSTAISNQKITDEFCKSCC